MLPMLDRDIAIQASAAYLARATLTRLPRDDGHAEARVDLTRINHYFPDADTGRIPVNRNRWTRLPLSVSPV